MQSSLNQLGQWFQNKKISLAKRLLASSDERYVLVSRESCGIILKPDGMEVLAIESCEREETFYNALLMSGVLSILAQPERNMTLEMGVQAGGRQMGVTSEKVEEFLDALIGPVAKEEIEE